MSLKYEPSSEQVHLLDFDSGALRSTMVGHEEKVLSIAFSADGSTLTSGSYDGTCKVWDSSTGALLRTINVQRPVLSVAWGRDWVRDKQRTMAFGAPPAARGGVAGA